MYIADKEGIPFEYILNLYETMIHICPMQRQMWHQKGQLAIAPVLPSHSKVAFTATLAISAKAGGPGPFTQLILQGETGQMSPCRSSAEGLLPSQIGVDRKWLAVLDCAPQHVAADFIGRVRLHLPNTKLAFIARGTTAWCQPLDTHYMRPYKCSIRWEWARGLMLELNGRVDGYGVVRSFPTMNSDIMDLAAGALRE
eukprot:3100675-Amphidinium_carterae.1